jgi:hypothetical protein
LYKTGETFIYGPENFTFFSGVKKSLTRKYSMHCPFRGVYTLGLKELAVTDILNIITIRLPIWHKTFYVYPRVFILDQPKIATVGDVAKPAGTEMGKSTDYALYRNLREYRYPENVRHIAWKRLFTSGIPFVKVYEETSWPGITLYFDTRRLRQTSFEICETEDCSVEILVALVHYMVQQNIPVYIRAAGWEPFPVSPGSTESFNDFLKSTITLSFDSESSSRVSPHELYKMDSESNQLNTGTIVLVSHNFDSETASFFQPFSYSGINVSLILNCTHMQADEKQQARILAEQINDEHEKISFVFGPDSIKEDMEQTR